MAKGHRSQIKRERNEQRDTRPSAKISYARVSVQKACFVLDAIRGKDVTTALGILTYNPRYASSLIKKLLESAIANAENNNGMDPETEVVMTMGSKEGLASLATTFMTAPWQLWLLWGFVIGIGTGAMALVFGAIVANRWFHTHRGLVMGVFSAANATGQLIFLPAIAWAAEHHGWRSAAYVTVGLALLMSLLIWLFLGDQPADRGMLPYGVAEGYAVEAPPATTESPALAAIRVLRQSSRSWAFWALVLTFWVCGWSTNGLIQTHFIPAAHDHGMAQTTAAGLLALVGIFDVLGTVASGWLTDRMDSRVLLAIYYGGRGLSLLAIDAVLAPNVEPGMWVFIVFYGLDWVATVPPTVALCRRHFGIKDSGMVFGWVFCAHMVGAGIGASIAGWIRTASGSYHSAWLLAAALCFISVGLALSIRKRPMTVAT